MWLSVLSARTKPLVAWVCFVFPLRLLHVLGILLCTPPQYFWMQRRGRAQNSCCNNAAAVAVVTSCVCVFPNSFLANIQRHGGDVPAQAARRTPGAASLQQAQPLPLLLLPWGGGVGVPSLTHVGIHRKHF